jgi:peptidoglycan/LPS O-acetylase OafA/YrhL
VGNFYLRRMLRIWPLYYSFLGLIVYLGSVGWESPMGGYLWPYLLLAGNWACAFWSFPFTNAAHLWSVCIEEQFYLFWPLAVRWLTARRVAAGAWLMIGSSVFYRILMTLWEIHYPAIWTATLTRLDSLAAGILVAALLGDRLPRLSSARRLLLFGGGLLLWLAVLELWPLAADPALGAAIIGYPAIAAGAAAMLVAAIRPAGERPGWLGSRPLVYLGRISYGLYVFHTLVLGLIRQLLPGLGRESWPTGLVSLAATIAVASLSYFLLERPFLKLKERFAAIRSRPA